MASFFLFISLCSAAMDVEYNRLDGSFRYYDIRSTEMINVRVTQTPQRIVRYDDEWSAIKKPTHYPTHSPTTMEPTRQPTPTPSLFPTSHPTNRPTTPKPTNIPTSSPTKLPTKQPSKTDDELLAEHRSQSKQSIASKQSTKHIIKLYSTNRDNTYPTNAEPRKELETHLLRDRAQFDQMLVKRSLFKHPQSEKIKICQTNIDIVFEGIYNFFEIMYQPQIHSPDLYLFLMQTVSDLRIAKMNDIFYDIHSHLIEANLNNSNAIELGLHMMEFYKDESFQVNTDPTFDHSVIPMVLDFFITVFDKLLTLKLKELDMLCKPSRFPLPLKHVITEQIRRNVNMSVNMNVLVRAFQKTVKAKYEDTELSIKDRIVRISEGLYRFTLSLVDIKDDLEIFNLINQWMKTHKASTIYVISEFIDHKFLETLLLYLGDDIRFEKYFAQKMKKKFRMISVPKLNITKQIALTVESKDSTTKRKKKKKKCTEKMQPSENLKNGSLNHDVIKLVKGTKCMDEFERDLIGWFSKNSFDDDGNYLFIIKGDTHNQAFIKNSSMQIITYFSEIDCAFEKLVSLLINLEFPNIEYFRDNLLPRLIVAIYQISPRLFDKIHSRLYEKYIDVQSIDNEVKYIYIWMQHFWNLLQKRYAAHALRDKSEASKQVRLPKLTKAESIGIILDLWMYSLQELYEIKFYRMRFDINHTYSTMMALFQQNYVELSQDIEEFMQTQEMLTKGLPVILHGIISLDPKKETDRINI